MSDDLIVMLLLYGIATIIATAIPLIGVRDEKDARDRKRLARIAAINMIWPAWIPIGIGYGVYRWIQIARTGE